MIKRTLILFLIILLTACSNLNKYVVTDSEKEQLISRIREVKEDLSKNNSKTLTGMFKPSLKSDYILGQLKILNFQGIKIFFSQPEFQGSLAKNTIAFNSLDNTIYMELEYKFENGIWHITDVKERRR